MLIYRYYIALPIPRRGPPQVQLGPLGQPTTDLSAVPDGPRPLCDHRRPRGSQTRKGALARAKEGHPRGIGGQYNYPIGAPFITLFNNYALLYIN